MLKRKKNRGKTARGGFCNYTSTAPGTTPNFAACALALAGLKLLCQALQMAFPLPAMPPVPWLPNALLAGFAVACAVVPLRHRKEVAMK